MAKTSEAAAPPTADDILQQMATALQQAADGRAERSKAVELVATTLSSLNAKDYPELAQNPVVQAFIDQLAESRAKSNPGEDAPGTVYDRGKLTEHKRPWSYHDLNKLCDTGVMPVVTVIPTENISVWWNGLRFNFLADVEQHVPQCFVDVLGERRRNLKFGRENADFLFQKGRPTHPDQVTPDSVRVRGMGDSGHYLPGGGVIAGAAGDGAEG